MANDVFTGPISYVVYGFPPSASIGDGLAAVLERVDTGVVEILDIEYITIDDANCPVVAALTELEGDYAAFDGALSQLLDDDDLALIAESLDSGWFAIAVVYEDRALAAAGAAWTQCGGAELLTGGIDIEQLAATVE